MATATLQQVLTAVKTRLTAVTSLLALYDQVPDSLEPPCAVVQPSPGDLMAYDSMSGEACVYRIYITMFVPAADMPSAQNLLYPYLAPSGSNSIRAAVAGQVTSPAFMAIAVDKVTNLRPITNEEGARYLACDIVLRVDC